MGGTGPHFVRSGALQSPDLFKALVWILLVLAALILFAQLSLGWTRGSRLFLTDLSRVESLDFPLWAPRAWKEDVRAAFQGGSVLPVSSDEGPAVVRNRLLRLPFVREVQGIRRVYPRSYAGQVVLRRPIALVQSGAGRLALDEDGVVLPGRPGEPGGGFGFPLPVVRLFKDPPRSRSVRPGEEWTDAEVRQAICVARDVDSFVDLHPGFAITEIDCTNLGGRRSKLESEVVLKTNGGIRILWGRPSAGSPYGELSPDTKRENLSRVLEQFPGLKGVQVLDLRFDRPAVHVDPALGR